MPTSQLDFGAVLRRHRQARGLTTTPLARDIFASKLAAARLDLTEERPPRPGRRATR